MDHNDVCVRRLNAYALYMVIDMGVQCLCYRIESGLVNEHLDLLLQTDEPHAGDAVPAKIPFEILAGPLVFEKAVVDAILTPPVQGYDNIVLTCINEAKKPIEGPPVFSFSVRQPSDYWFADIPATVRRVKSYVSSCRPNEYDTIEEMPPGAGCDLKDDEEAPCLRIGPKPHYLGLPIAAIPTARKDVFVVTVDKKTYVLDRGQLEFISTP